jgi:biopolymer transport protein TolR
MAFSMNTDKKTALSEINVTPLVDVMLVLLIIFMVTAPMMQEGVSVDLPEAKASELQREQTADEVVISVSGPGNIFVNDVAVKEDQLEAKILELTRDRPTRAVYLRGDKTVPYGIVARIMATLMNAGVKNLSIITSPEKESSSAR